VEARTERDEVSKIEGCAACRDGLDVVNLEPAGPPQLVQLCPSRRSGAVRASCHFAVDRMSTPGSPAARRCRDRSRSQRRHGPRWPSAAGPTVSPHDGHNRRTVISCVSALEVAGTIGTREPAYPSLPQGESIGQPPACQLPSAAPAPSFFAFLRHAISHGHEVPPRQYEWNQHAHLFLAESCGQLQPVTTPPGPGSVAALPRGAPRRPLPQAEREYPRKDTENSLAAWRWAGDPQRTLRVQRT
jgi:hypothetical protein